MSYHGNSLDQAIWVLENFGTETFREYYRGNISYENWIEHCQNIIDAERLNY